MQRPTYPLALAALFALLLTPCLTAAPVTVQGRVLDFADRSLAGALVRSSAPAGEAAAAKTDDAGLFQLSAAPDGPFQVRIEAPGFVTVERTLPPVPAAAGLPPARLVPGRRLGVEVLDPDGVPVDGALVVVSPLVEQLGPGWRAAPVRVETGPQGRVELATVSNSTLRLEVRATGHPPLLRSVDPEHRSLVLRLQAGRPARFEVTADGDAAAGVKIRLTGGATLGESGRDGSLEAVLPATEVTVQAVAADGSWAEARAPVGRTNVSLRLAPADLVAGQVVDRDDGAPLAGAWVWHPPAPAQAVRSDAAGRFVLPVDPFADIPLRLTATAVGHRGTSADTGNGEARLALPPAVTLGGRLLDPAGQPVAGAAVRVAAADRTEPEEERATWGWSGEDGRFQLAGLPPGEEVWLRARRAGYAPLLQPLTLPAAGEPTTLRLRLQPAHPAFGQVVDGAGEGVRGATVELLPTSARDSAAGLLTAGEHRISATTDAAGRFIVEGLAVGTVEAEIGAPGL
ncbi:MAG TPA: carboxypeptidase-like regulatory domain-containing protein, partial [Thermoanaerobaculia bacterium]|nr:carboxypeptidase-like regulatory domain-containing protein [Thermoanaerobaculia bacterium]